MYVEHFGLKSKPFSSTAEGPAVFVGPRQAEVMKNLNKGLRAIDSVVAVSGPVGVGKTTVVTRALESLSPGRMVAWIGRLGLAADEVLELLLAGFGVNCKSMSTIQRFAAFRRLLGERTAAGTRVAIVVEDAQRMGPDTLAELEALTAADSGDAIGANIILMGQPGLNDWLAAPTLARVNQRTRLRQSVEPLSAAEVRGYLRNCIRVAGGDYDSAFAEGAADMLYRCSGGIPRIINNLSESALTTVAESGAGVATAEVIRIIARDALGVEVDIEAEDDAEGVVDAAAEPLPIPEPMEPAPSTLSEESVDETTDSIESTMTEKRPDWMLQSPDDDEEIPAELTVAVEATAKLPKIDADTIAKLDEAIQKPSAEFTTAPTITVEQTIIVEDDPDPVAEPPAENPAAAAEQESVPEPEPAPAPAPAMQLELEPEAETELEAAPEPEAATKLETAPEPEQEIEPEKQADSQPDPTLELELVPEAADDVAERIDAEDISAVDTASENAKDGSGATLEGIPALTLDDSLDEARKTVPTAEVPAEKAGGDADARMAEELSKAKSLDDLDDEMAATLFGDENFEAIAAAAIANAPGNVTEEASPSDDSETSGTDATPTAAAEAPPAAVADPAPKPKAAEASGGKSNGVASPTAGIDQRKMGYTGEFRMSLTSRFRMVDELAKDKAKPVYSAIVKEKPAAKAAATAPEPAPKPKSLEEQLNSADGASPGASAGAAKKAKPGTKEKTKSKSGKSGGLLSRFKR